jgi:hypothetical protein
MRLESVKECWGEECPGVTWLCRILAALQSGTVARDIPAIYVVRGYALLTAAYHVASSTRARLETLDD